MDFDEIQEWDVIYRTRLGMLCGSTREPSTKEKQIASDEADEHIERLKHDISRTQP